MRPALLLAPMLALAAAPASAEPGDARCAPAADADAGPPPQHRAVGVDVTGRIRATQDGVVLEVASARVELRRLRGAAAPAPTPPGAHDLRASFSLDGRVTSFLLRVLPPPNGGGGEAPPR